MHEMSIAQNILEIAQKEAAEKGCNHILRIRVEYGPLSGLMPEALAFCMEALCRGTPNEGLHLELVKIPFTMRCLICNTVFTGHSRESMWEPCPACGEVIGHQIENGHSIILTQLEADHQPCCHSRENM